MNKTLIYLRPKGLQAVLLVFLVQLVSLEYGCGSTKKRFEMGYRPHLEPPGDVYDTTSIKTVTGITYGIDTFIYKNEIDIININLEGKDGNRYFVQVAPSWYLKAKRVSFHNGEEITVTGSMMDPSTFEEEEEEELEEEEGEAYIILAREIKKKGKALLLRNRDGKPLWYRQGMLRGRQLYIQKYLKDKSAGIEPEGPMPWDNRQNVSPLSNRKYPPRSDTPTRR